MLLDVKNISEKELRRVSRLRYFIATSLKGEEFILHGENTLPEICMLSFNVEGTELTAVTDSNTIVIPFDDKVQIIPGTEANPNAFPHAEEHHCFTIERNEQQIYLVIFLSFCALCRMKIISQKIQKKIYVFRPKKKQTKGYIG